MFPVLWPQVRTFLFIANNNNCVIIRWYLKRTPEIQSPCLFLYSFHLSIQQLLHFFRRLFFSRCVYIYRKAQWLYGWQKFQRNLSSLYLQWHRITTFGRSDGDYKTKVIIVNSEKFIPFGKRQNTQISL